ncbi:dynein axonemal intermediate chain 3-like [Vespula maculifrons]|uniref:Dynein axonemal intermediate chain 3-like n=1 Tax=Vespula maculifrons TaxID=7453 RepID=A0ABD2AX44_VESMC
MKQDRNYLDEPYSLSAFLAEERHGQQSIIATPAVAGNAAHGEISFQDYFATGSCDSSLMITMEKSDEREADDREEDEKYNYENEIFDDEDAVHEKRGKEEDAKEKEKEEEKEERVVVAEKEEMYVDEVEMEIDEGEYEEIDKDWEKRAKKRVHIELIDEFPGRRKTIYELDAYEASGPSYYDILQLGKVEEEVPPKRLEIRYSISMGAGIARIDLSPSVQQMLGCVIGENVTTEYPWVWVQKETIEDDLQLHSESSEFLAMKDEIFEYPERRMLIGYAPSITEEGQFYICLSTEAKENVLQQIQIQRRSHEIRVRNAVYKQPAEWKDLGSGKEVDENVIKNQRPQIEIEVVSTANLLNVPMNLVDRRADDQRDGYIDLLPYRQTFENVSRSTISRPTQVTPSIKDNDAQTAPSIPVNSSFQYQYEYKPIDISAFTEEDTENLTRFLRRYTDIICDQVQMNATWDIYADDYTNLVHYERDTKAPIPVEYKEHQSFYSKQQTEDRVINDLSWHPVWSDIACVTYTYYAKSEYYLAQEVYDQVLRDCKGNNVALIWSFNDCLSPKLILECQREITSISICPLDGNTIIGGCANGQVSTIFKTTGIEISIWSIPGKIESIEAVVVHTSAQIKYKVTLRSLMTWIKEIPEWSIVRPVAMSSSYYSQKGAISQIAWIPPYHKVEKNGRIQSLENDTALEDLPLQFITCSMDGTIAFWDLKENIPRKDVQKEEQKKPLPPELMEFTSPFRSFDRLWKPYYTLIVQYPNESRCPMLTTFDIYSPKLKREELFPAIKTDITIRRYYKFVSEKPDYIMEPEIFIGTVEGYVGLITWEGFEDNNLLKREECKWKWIKRIHNGPVTHIARSEYHKKIVATVGGNIFAVWREDFGEPIIWKKSQLRYTGCSWVNFRPTILVLARLDGSMEIWDFIVRSQEPTITQSVSGHIIMGIYTHELPLEPQCMAICDYNGTLRIYTAPPILLTFDVSDIKWMQDYFDQQVDRISEFKKWQDAWNKKNFERIDKKKKLDEKKIEEERIEAEIKHREEMAELLKKAQEEERAKGKRRKPWQFIEDTKERWREMEMKRMQITVLEKKGLRRDVLERQRAPILKIRQEAQKKEKNIREILQQRDHIFKETVTFLFPEQEADHKLEDRDQISLPYIVPKPLKDIELTIPEKSKIQEEARQLLEEFQEVEQEALEIMIYQEFEHVFDWPTVLKQARKRKEYTYT